jgi:hypothetical protein
MRSLPRTAATSDVNIFGVYHCQEKYRFFVHSRYQCINANCVTTALITNNAGGAK